MPIQIMKQVQKTTHLRLLLVEDNPDDATFIEESLRFQDVFAGLEICRVSRLRDCLTALAKECFDVVLLDLSLPDASCTDSVTRILTQCPKASIIVLTGLDDKEVAVDALQKGAQDFLIKDGVSGELLVRAIRYALERRKAEQAAKIHAAQELEDLIFTLANDLRVPHIGAMRAFDLLVNESLGELNDDQKSLLLKIKHSSQEVLHMLQNLVHLYRHQQSGQKILAIPTDLDRLVKQVIDDWKFMADENAVSIQFSQNFDDPVFVDSTCFKKVLSNLVHNAIKFSAPNGQVNITCNSDKAWIDLTVKDDGKGIAKPEQEKLFQRFWTENDNMRHSYGSGVGLYVCNQIVEAHGGSISCESEEGNGAAFTVKIPFIAR